MKMLEQKDWAGMSAEALWNEFSGRLDKTRLDEEEAYQKIRWGIKIKFDITRYIQGIFEYKPSRGKMRFKNIVYEDEEVWTEIEERRRLMIKIIEARENKEPIKPRGF